MDVSETKRKIHQILWDSHKSLLDDTKVTTIEGVIEVCNTLLTYNHYKNNPFINQIVNKEFYDEMYKLFDDSKDVFDKSPAHLRSLIDGDILDVMKETFFYNIDVYMKRLRITGCTLNDVHIDAYRPVYSYYQTGNIYLLISCPHKESVTRLLDRLVAKKMMHKEENCVYIRSDVQSTNLKRPNGKKWYKLLFCETFEMLKCLSMYDTTPFSIKCKDSFKINQPVFTSVIPTTEHVSTVYMYPMTGVHNVLSTSNGTRQILKKLKELKVDDIPTMTIVLRNYGEFNRVSMNMHIAYSNMSLLECACACACDLIKQAHPKAPIKEFDVIILKNK